jgi:phosphomethylpyrimidine synthase
MRTLIQECVAGIPPLVEGAARQEGQNPRDFARAVARGHVVIPSNPIRPHRICAIGEGCRVKVNVNIGTSGERCDPDLEKEKALAAIANGTDTLKDLSTGGDLEAIRKSIL